jgi:hypothetical protein
MTSDSTASGMQATRRGHAVTGEGGIGSGPEVAYSRAAAKAAPQSLLKQLKRPYTIWKFSRGRGLEGETAWLGALSGKGWWLLSRTPQSHMSMTLKWFDELGLISLSVRWRELRLAEGNRLGA